MESTKPYLIRAIHEWCTDQGFTPYLAVAVDSDTRVPREFVRDGQIVLNVGTEATGQLQMGNREITFQARFNGVAFPVYVPVAAVAAIYARENGQGMAFETGSEAAEEQSGHEEIPDGVADERLKPAAEADSAAQKPSGATPAARPHLTRIK